MAVFVDAGYLFAQVAQRISGPDASRKSVECDLPSFIEGLGEFLTDEHPGNALLRTYWYDGAIKGRRTPEHDTAAGLARLKLRLGRTNVSGQPKGIATLMVRDLMVLAQERSISRAVLVTGNGDLLEGFEYAQERGVLVTLLKIHHEKHNANLPTELLDAADDIVTMSQGLLDMNFTSRGKTPVSADPESSQGAMITQDDPKDV